MFYYLELGMYELFLKTLIVMIDYWNYEYSTSNGLPAVHCIVFYIIFIYL